jgi:hypothetical protein
MTSLWLHDIKRKGAHCKHAGPLSERPAIVKLLGAVRCLRTHISLGDCSLGQSPPPASEQERDMCSTVRRILTHLQRSMVPLPRFAIVWPQQHHHYAVSYCCYMAAATQPSLRSVAKNFHRVVSLFLCHHAASALCLMSLFCSSRICDAAEFVSTCSAAVVCHLKVGPRTVGYFAVTVPLCHANGGSPEGMRLMRLLP